MRESRDPYQNITTQTPIKRLYQGIIALIILALGYLYLSHWQDYRGPYKSLRAKHTQENIREICAKQGHQLQLHCFRRDYLSFLREANPYEAILGHRLQTSIYQRDNILIRDETLRLYLYMEQLDLNFLFLKINENIYLNRQRPNIGSILLAHIFRNNVINQVRSDIDLIEQIKQNYQLYLDETPLTQRRFKALKKNYLEIIERLRD